VDLHRLSEQLLPGALRSRAGAPARSCPTTTGAKASARAQSVRPKPGVELGHHLPAHHRAWRLVVLLSGDRRLVPQGGGLGLRRTGRPKTIAADLVGRACIRERISKGRKQPLILHAENGNAMRAATLEARLEELRILRSFSRPRMSDDNPYSESLFRTTEYRPDYPSRPFASVEEACLWVASFVD
jgi:transposase InsO family protein